jgi:succinate dehydrogenase / fumarate reductase cytochrome b subunit
MTTATAATHSSAPRAGSLIERHYFLLRRLHSATGIFPIGLFLIPHLTTNSSIVWGQLFNAKKYAALGAGAAGVATFQHEVDFIHNLPALIFIEIFVLWLPIAFHAGLGVYFARTGIGNYSRYAYQDNMRYTLQRITGYIGVAFIFLHIASLRWGWTFGGLLPTFDPDRASSSVAIHMQDGLLGGTVAILYLVCVLALVFHFANGLWTAGITWGLTVSAGAQRRWGQVCAALGIALALAGVTAVGGFMTLDAEKAQAIEERLEAERPDGDSPTADAAVGARSAAALPGT